MRYILGFIGVLALSCGAPKGTTMAPLIQGITEFKGEFVLGVGEHADGFALEDGNRVDILYEGNSTFGLLTKPGLRFTLPDSGTVYTSGLGYFELGSRDALVERIPGTRTSPAHLKVTFLPPANKLLSVQDSAEVVLQALRSDGVGFNGYGWQVRGHLIDVAVYREGDPSVVQGTVNRLTHELQKLQRVGVILPTPDIARKTVENLYFQDATVSQVHGSPGDVASAHMLEKVFSECAIFDIPVSAEVIISGGETKIEHSGDYPEDSFEIRNLRECTESVLGELDFHEVRFRVDFVYESTFVRTAHAGKSLVSTTLVNPSPDAEIGVIMESGSATTRNEIRRAARRDWSALMRCGKHRTTYERVSPGAEFNPFSEAECLTDIVSQWKTTSSEPAKFIVVIR